MKAAPVKGLDPAGPLGENAAKIVLTRLDELCGFMPRAGDPRRVKALHDMRIAAKRLRYVLEVTGPAFDRDAVAAVDEIKQLQEILGEIHDCDVQIPEVDEFLHRIMTSDARAVTRGDEPPDRDAYAGLVALGVQLRARRDLLFVEFLKLWQDWQSRDVTGMLRRAVDHPSRG